ncbi:hypothetical protein [Marinomonas ostreistagni]|uniref:DUF8051 domain-containing protein n=1 Tax=Marinomonas ostreistagni TaxID=359209 RepID=A0ABS0ZB43_9GAMM|nr:hypothetical protein [Marinomonas ostreistagni]MBJ7550886.1 hypothetical protein [Marinomonas ostreistagni]
MEHYLGYAVASLLGLSVLLLATLIPGGPIENRDFSHISPMTLGIFNVFLTVLGIGSLILVYFVLAGSKLAVIASVLCGISYFFVYALDLGKIFPISPDKMPKALFWIELVGLILSIPLTLFSFIHLFMLNTAESASGISFETTFLILVAVIVFGVGIVIFATKSAMKSSSNKAN